MKRFSKRFKALRYLWHGIAKLGEVAFFLLLLPLILIGALLPGRSADANKTPKTAVGNPAQPRP
ncbi:MAG: hypothetical protein CFE34_17470 [Rhodobacteraceae bacterium PARR1]|nr:MAG: hypothetical protein CFE34_17470 [Rhodobacteraceae bacterium PARR1]